MNLLWTPHNRASLGALRAQIPTMRVTFSLSEPSFDTAFEVYDPLEGT